MTILHLTNLLKSGGKSSMDKLGQIVWVDTGVSRVLPLDGNGNVSTLTTDVRTVQR